MKLEGKREREREELGKKDEEARLQREIGFRFSMKFNVKDNGEHHIIAFLFPDET